MDKKISKKIYHLVNILFLLPKGNELMRNLHTRNESKDIVTLYNLRLVCKP